MERRLIGRRRDRMRQQPPSSPGGVPNPPGGAKPTPQKRRAKAIGKEPEGFNSISPGLRTGRKKTPPLSALRPENRIQPRKGVQNSRGPGSGQRLDPIAGECGAQGGKKRCGHRRIADPVGGNDYLPPFVVFRKFPHPTSSAWRSPGLPNRLRTGTFAVTLSISVNYSNYKILEGADSPAEKFSHSGPRLYRALGRTLLLCPFNNSAPPRPTETIP